MTNDRLLEISIVARRLRVCAQTVRRWIHAGKLAAERTPGGHWRVRESQIQQSTTNTNIRNTR